VEGRRWERRKERRGVYIGAIGLAQGWGGLSYVSSGRARRVGRPCVDRVIPHEVVGELVIQQIKSRFLANSQIPRFVLFRLSGCIYQTDVERKTPHSVTKQRPGEGKNNLNQTATFLTRGTLAQPTPRKAASRHPITRESRGLLNRAIELSVIESTESQESEESEESEESSYRGIAESRGRIIKEPTGSKRSNTASAVDG
jgi:hypothetical protein